MMNVLTQRTSGEGDVGLFSSLAAFGRRIQSDVVLRTARGFYLVVACISLFAILLAVLVAVVAQGSTFRSAMDRPVPDVAPLAVDAIAVQDVAARLAPPQNVHFVQDPAVINFNVTEGQVLGYFDASTPNQLASYPDDFDVVGGEHAALVQLGRHARGRAGLRATAALAQNLNEAQADLSSTTTQRQLNLRVIARDRAGQLSSPADLAVILTLGPPSAAQQLPLRRNRP